MQSIGLLVGLMIVRTLPVEEYAYYTISVGMLGLMNQLSDVGIGSGLLALGGGMWSDRSRFGSLIASTLQCRRMFMAGAVLIVTPFMGWLCYRAGASTGYSVLLVVLVWLAVALQVGIGIYTAAPRLHSQISRLQRLDLGAVSGRLLLVSLAANFNAACVVAVNTMVLGAQAWFARQWTHELIERKAPATPEQGREILQLVLRQLPNAIFYCLLGQVTLVVIGIFGQTQQIAEVGALGRLSAIFGIVGSVMSLIVCPRLARAQGGRELARQYCAVLAIFVGAATLALVLCSLFSSEVFWVLGPNYARLESLAPWIVLMAACNSLLGIVWAMNAVKGWTRGVWLTIPAIVLAQIALAPWLDLSSVKGAVVFGCLPLLAALPILFHLARKGIRAASDNHP